MKTVGVRIRTPNAIPEWYDFLGAVKQKAGMPRLRINGKQRNADGCYSSMEWEVPDDQTTDLLMEILIFLNGRVGVSFDLSVKDTGPLSQRAPVGPSPLAGVNGVLSSGVQQSNDMIQGDNDE